MSKKTTIVILFSTLIFTSGCGQSETPALEQICPKEYCTEASINAPLETPTVPTSSEDLREVGIDRTSYNPPEFQTSWGLSKNLYERAVKFYLEHPDRIQNKRYLTIIDMRLHSSLRRFYLFDLATGTLERHNTSHGKNSDKDNDGYATSFSNELGSLQTSLGFYLTLGTYEGSNGYSMRLDGLDSTNSNALKRAIVVHPADYISDSQRRAGRSWGCPALDPKISRTVINRIKNGSLLLIDRG